MSEIFLEKDATLYFFILYILFIKFLYHISPETSIVSGTGVPAEKSYFKFLKNTLFAKGVDDCGHLLKQ